ncbi:hypothetical protein J6B42_10620 [Bacillus velezensis]|nr:hypothetical protein IL989_10145 [Bacillus amyloliquefaciens]QPG19854.1 hypothetical protein IXY25_02245 [Bacillus velezensis]QPG23573.1 hypothetical protein IXY24_08130 [Bacillus velezensis]UQB59761.1 hypothetical protein J6B42_10620 [Bacillus velezensis]
MEFRVYQLTYANDLTENGGALHEYLASMAKLPGEHGFEYCITSEIDYDDHVITFCFSEEFASDVSSVDDEKNIYTPDVAPYINTIMALDLREKRFLVQNRDYPANNLKKDLTMTRIRLMLNEAFENTYNSVFNTLDTDREVNENEFIHLFENNRVSALWVTIPNNYRVLPEHEQIFEDEAINRNWIEGWNNDHSKMHEILLKAPGRGGEGDLRHSPIAKSLLNMVGAYVKQINYWDENDKSHEVSRNSLMRFVVNGINIRSLPVTSIDRLSLEIRNRREELREFRASDEI